MLRSILPPKMEERITHRATRHACKHTAHVAAYRSTHTKDYNVVLESTYSMLCPLLRGHLLATSYDA